MAYTLILQNLASRKEYLVRGLQDSSETYLCYVFENFVMPEGAEEGEYEGLLFIDNRNDCEYTLSDVPENTLISTTDGDVQVKHLRPERFILKYGEVAKTNNTYREDNKTFYSRG